ncbi:hypothetical protein BGW36DRAFT_430571 [Talaromyces proteolyticus]|uniref:AB hydrolase-1 domain-containing protein n=1 Tax=Talaromyces proteolyticus TaxID=1131652 RepID=A0AAD4KP12_9EURO|nr:uncharacterized protein BGW36DRAFT_430571 [Talaromyces proteolyticus]KAH8692826.1 hypothetical protein BGW36DRAFT_430571 [Talaromyces proteolyticus]
MKELSFPVTRFTGSFGGGKLPGHFYHAIDPAAPTGLVQEQGLHWEAAVENPIAAVIDESIARFVVESSKLALLGMSIGGYLACRAAAHESQLAEVIATSPLPRPLELFEKVAEQDAGATASMQLRRTTR